MTDPLAKGNDIRWLGLGEATYAALSQGNEALIKTVTSRPDCTDEECAMLARYLLAKHEDEKHEAMLKSFNPSTGLSGGFSDIFNSFFAAGIFTRTESPEYKAKVEANAKKQAERDAMKAAMRTYVYFIQMGDGPIKIGKSDDPDRRLLDFKTASPHKCHVLKRIKAHFSLEAQLHKKFAHIRLEGEWFKPEQELLDYIESATDS